MVQTHQQAAFAGEAFDVAAAVQLPVQKPDGAFGVEPSVSTSPGSSWPPSKARRVLWAAGSAAIQQHGLMVRARSFPGNRDDAHTLAAQIDRIEQIDCTTTLLQDVGVKPTTDIVDLDCRSADNDLAPVEVIQRGKLNFLEAKQKRWLRQRQTTEPLIGQIKIWPPHGPMPA